MKVLLTEDVVGFGDIGDEITVKAGFARNYLIPRGMAVEIGARSAKQIAHRMRQIEAKKKRLQGVAEQRAEELRNITVELELRVGTAGKVFGSIGTRDIAAALASMGFEIDRRRVQLAEPIKRPGTHFVPVKLHPEVQVQVKLNVSEVQASKAELEKEAAAAKKALEDAAEANADEASDEQAGSDAASTEVIETPQEQTTTGAAAGV